MPSRVTDTTAGATVKGGWQPTNSGAMDMRLDGEIPLVTGGSRGNGEAFCRALMTRSCPCGVASCRPDRPSAPCAGSMRSAAPPSTRYVNATRARRLLLLAGSSAAAGSAARPGPTTSGRSRSFSCDTCSPWQPYLIGVGGAGRCPSLVSPAGVIVSQALEDPPQFCQLVVRQFPKRWWWPIEDLLGARGGGATPFGELDELSCAVLIILAA